MQNKLKCREFQHCSGMHIKTSRHDCRREKLGKKFNIDRFENENFRIQ